mgnify:CR=1 FL=1|jgi:hypothetical protein
MIKNYYLGGFGMSEIRDKKIEVRLTEAEKEQIKKYFDDNCMNLSIYLRKHLLELTK